MKKVLPLAALVLVATVVVSCSGSLDSVGRADGGGSGDVATPSTVDPRLTYGSGIPFGPTKLPVSEMGGVFTGTKLSPWPGSILEDLETARSHGMKVFLVLVGSQSNYTDPDGSFNLDNWKQRVDRFRDVDFSEYIDDGTIIGHQIIDEAKARSQWDGTVIPNEVIDEMARYSKEIWPEMLAVLRVEPTQLEEHAGGYEVPMPDFEWRYLDAAWAPYLVRKGDVLDYAVAQQRSADEQGLGLVLELNSYNGGDGSSGIPSPARDGKWAMSADELIEYGSTMIRETKGCALVIWRYETTGSEFEDVVYFRRPDISQAVEVLASMAADAPAYPCRSDG